MLSGDGVDGFQVIDLESRNGTALTVPDFRERVRKSREVSVRWSCNDDLFLLADGSLSRYSTSDTGAPAVRYQLATGSVLAFDASEQGDLLVAASEIGLQVFKRTSGERQANLFTLRSGTAVVVAPSGHFDTTSFDDIKALNWVVPQAPNVALPIEVFTRNFFEPRLLVKTRAVATTGLPIADDLSRLNVSQPPVKIINVRLDRSQHEAQVTVMSDLSPGQASQQVQKSASPYDLRLFRNGQLVGQWPEPKAGSGGPQDIHAWREASRVPMEPGQTKAEHTFRVALPSRDRGKPVVFTAYAFNDDRVKSETARNDEFKVPEDMPLRTPRAYVITVGVNSYELKGRDLSFAAKDAKDLSAALSRIKDHEVVGLTLVSDDAQSGGATRQATKANIRAVLELLAGKSETERARLKSVAGIDKKAIDQLRKVTPDDLVIIAFSGHGYTDPSNGQFYLLPSDSGKDPGLASKAVRACRSGNWSRSTSCSSSSASCASCPSAASDSSPTIVLQAWRSGTAAASRSQVRR